MVKDNRCINIGDYVEYNGKVYSVTDTTTDFISVCCGAESVVLTIDDIDIVEEQYFTDLIEFDENGNEIDNDWDNGIEDTICGFDLSADVAVSLVTERYPNKSIALIYPCEFDMELQRWVIPAERKLRIAYTTMEKNEITTIDLSNSSFVQVVM